MSVSLRLSMGNPYKKMVCQNTLAELCGPNTRMLNVSFGVCNKVPLYWASEANPTLGCSIEISRYIYLCHSYYGNSHVIKVIISLLNFVGI